MSRCAILSGGIELLAKLNLVGRAVRRYGAVMDITARKEAVEAQVRNNERLRQAVRVANIGIFDRDYSSNALFWTPEMA